MMNSKGTDMSGVHRSHLSSGYYSGTDMSGANKTHESSGYCSGTDLSGASETHLSSGYCSCTFMSGANKSRQSSGCCSGTDMSGANKTHQLSGYCDGTHLSGPNMPHRVGGFCDKTNPSGLDKPYYSGGCCSGACWTSLRTTHRSSGYCSGTEMSTILIRSNYGYLVNEISPLDIMDRLVAEHLITERELVDIQSMHSVVSKNDLIVKSILRKSNTDATVSRHFLRILEESYGWMHQKLHDNVSQRKSAVFSTSCEDIERHLNSHSKKLIESIHATRTADCMFEVEALQTHEHDSVISYNKESLRARELLDIVIKKRNFTELIAALQRTKQSCMVKLLTQEKEACPEFMFEGLELMEVDDKQTYKNQEERQYSAKRGEDVCKQSPGQECEEMEIVLSFEAVTHQAICNNIVQRFNVQTDHEMIDAEEYCVEQFQSTIGNIQEGCVRITLTPMSRDSFHRFRQKISEGQLTGFIKLLLSVQSVRQCLPKGTFTIRVNIILGMDNDCVVDHRLPNDLDEEILFRRLAAYIAERFSPPMLMKKLEGQQGIPFGLLSESKITPSIYGRRKATLSLLSEIKRTNSIGLQSINKILIDLLSENISLERKCPLCIRKHIIDQYRSYISDLDERTMNFFYEIVSTFDGDSAVIHSDTFGCRRDYAQKVLQSALKSNIRVLDLANVLDINGLNDLHCPPSCDELHKKEACASANQAAALLSIKLTKKEIRKSYLCTNKTHGIGRNTHHLKPVQTTAQDNKGRVIEVCIDGKKEQVELRSSHHSAKVKVEEDYSESSVREQGKISITEIPQEESEDDARREILLKVYADEGYGSRSSSMQSTDSTDA